MTVQIIRGDCLIEMPKMAANSIDAIVTDPPYGLSFMGKNWDHGIPGTPFWIEALRAAKPGAHLLAFGGTRTFHRLACAIEDAGWEIRDCLMWIYGSGFPKSLDVSKAIDKASGKEREVVGSNPNHRPVSGVKYDGIYQGGNTGAKDITAPATDAAYQWSGWGTALKPAWEPIILARKPLEGTVAKNVLKWGTGALNIDKCRIEFISDEDAKESKGKNRHADFHSGARDNVIFGDDKRARGENGNYNPPGRWPANLIHDGSEEVVELFPESKSTGGINEGKLGKRIYGKFKNESIGANAGGLGDSGSAARFFYCAKASKADRDEGCEGMEERTSSSMPGRRDCSDVNWKADNDVTERFVTNRRNHHPTVKPTSLMRYLCRLVTPPGGIVLDPFMGSGSTGKAAILEGFGFIGIEIEAEYIEIAKARIKHAEDEMASKLPL